LRVFEGDVVKEGDIIADNFRERSRLSVQKESILLQISKLKGQKIISPPPVRKLLPLKPLPEADYSEETAAISQAVLRVQQAKSILASRSVWLNRVNDSAYQQALSKVDELNQMLKSMQDLKMQSEVIQHESVVLKQLQNEANKAKVELEQVKDRQAQELQQLHLNLQLAESELQQKRAALTAAHARRQMREFEADVDKQKREQQQQQIVLEHSHQVVLYEQQQRDKDYQLAELSIRQHQIEDKLADLPIVRSPKSGYIKHIRPWVGKDGKYITTLTISSLSHLSSNSRSGSSQGKTHAGTEVSPTLPKSEVDSEQGDSD
jgi:hypothetical protein